MNTIEKYCEIYLLLIQKFRLLALLLSYDLDNVDLQIELLKLQKIKIRLNYTLLLERISKEQGLGLHAHEMPLIIHTDLATYTMAYITYEDEEYLSIIVPSEDNAEYINVIYAQMLQEPPQPKEDVMYG